MAERSQGGPSVPPESYFSIFEFMSCEEGLGLKGVDLNVYALVYSYSQGRGGCYYGSNAMTAHRAGCSERHAIDVVHSLEERGLIANVGKRCLGGRSTNMYVADAGKVRDAIGRCLGDETPEASSGVNTGASSEEISGAPLNPAQASPDGSSPNKKAIGKQYEREEGEATFVTTPELFESSFMELLRAYPYTKDEAVARSLYEPLFLKGVRAKHVSSMLGEWAKAHPAKEGKRPFYPELSKFLDGNNPEGYAAYAEQTTKCAKAKRAKSVRELTARDYTSDIYERYAVDGCDPKATELYQRYLDLDGGMRRENWDYWYQFMMFKRDTEARSHWLDLREAGEL